ncbi:MAG TPA: methionyl-tRNA formyltransferase [Rhodothermales bacterium]
MGTPEFAVPSLERLVAEGYRPVAVVTGPDKPRGRGQVLSPTPVKETAEALGIQPILQPESVRDPAFADAVRALEPDVIVVVAFRILPPEVFTQARLGAFNLHGSLLPRYRGAAPIHRAVMAGETETGVTTFFLRETVDTGSIILRRSMPIGPDETTGEVHDRMMHLGAEAVVNTVRLIERGEANPIPQDDSAATPAPKIFREDAIIPWDQPARTVHNHVRGLSPLPGAWTLFDGRLLKIYRTRVANGSGLPGTVLKSEDALIVACGAGSVEILELQQEGKRRVTAEEFLRGNTLGTGTRLGTE